MNADRWGTSKEAAAHYGVTPDTIRIWANKGKVKWKKTPSGRKLIYLATQQEQDAAILARVLAPKRPRVAKPKPVKKPRTGKRLGYDPAELAEKMRQIRSGWALDRKPEGEPLTCEEVLITLADSVRLLKEDLISTTQANSLSRVVGRMLQVIK